MEMEHTIQRCYTIKIDSSFNLIHEQPTYYFDVITRSSHSGIRWGLVVNRLEIKIQDIFYLVPDLEFLEDEKEEEILQKLGKVIQEPAFLQNFYDDLFENPKTRLRLLTAIGSKIQKK